ncbi:MAG: acetate uptake transporter [Candidatus Methanofastidiosia archaeon]
MNQNTINPAPLGLAAFGLTTVLLNLVNAEILAHESIGMILSLGLFFGGLCQVFAGQWEVKTGNTFGATAFTAFGAFWLSLVLLVLLQNTGIVALVPTSGMAAFLAGWGVFTFYMTIATMKKPKALFVVFSTLTLLFFMLAAGQYNSTVHQLAGYEGIFCGASALYLSAAQIINPSFEREVMPVGKPLL